MGKTVLMVMDMQVGIVNLLGDVSALLSQTSTTIAAARKAGIPVIYVTISFRPGFPDLSPHNQTLSRVKAMGPVHDGDAAVQVHSAVAPQPGDILVTKRRASAFTGSDLDVVLRSQGADTLVMAGFATGGVVLSTVRQAADMDYRLTVLSDLCKDPDPEVHRVLIEKVFPKQCKIQTSTEWIEGLGAA